MLSIVVGRLFNFGFQPDRVDRFSRRMPDHIAEIEDLRHAASGQLRALRRARNKLESTRLLSRRHLKLDVFAIFLAAEAKPRKRWSSRRLRKNTPGGALDHSEKQHTDER